MTDYDKKFDKWLAEVKCLCNPNMNLPNFFNSIEKMDPYGAFDEGLTVQEYHAELKQNGYI